MRELIFVYNAKSGLFNAIADWTHRTFKPETYRCHLGRITCTSLGLRGEWKRFLQKLDLPVLFFKTDSLERKYPSAFFVRPQGVAFPCVLLREDKRMSLVMGAEEIAKCQSPEELIDALTPKLLALPKPAAKAPTQSPKAKPKALVRKSR